MGCTSERVVLIIALLCTTTATLLAQGIGTEIIRPNAASPPPRPGMPTRPNIPGSPGTALGPGQTGMPSRPVIPESPGTSFGADPNSARRDCLNGSVAVAGC
jgi:hypothetical protein